VKEHPIIFSTPMVKAINDGTKTQAMRLRKLNKINENPADWHAGGVYEGQVRFYNPTTKEAVNIKCPYGQVSDRLWVREAFKSSDVNELGSHCDTVALIEYKDGKCVDVSYSCDGDWWETARHNVWKPSIHMPRWASRINLEITEVRVERVQDISIEDIKLEGVDITYSGSEQWKVGFPHSDMAKLWNSINAKRGYGWDTNCWVWVISFKVVK